jgi:hypothetical protein
MSNPTTTNYIIIEGVFADGKHLISAELTEATPSPGKTREIPREVFATIRQVFKGTWTVGSDEHPTLLLLSFMEAVNIALDTHAVGYVFSLAPKTKDIGGGKTRYTDTLVVLEP